MIDLIVVNYKTPRDLSRFCDSVLTAPPKTDWRLTVMDVCAPENDHTWTQIADRFRAADLKAQAGCCSLPENIGYGRACNFGVYQTVGLRHGAQSGYLAFFNADVTLMPGAVDEIVEAMDAHPDWGIVGPRQVDSRGHITHAGIFGTEDRPQHRAWQRPNHHSFGDVAEAITVSGAAMFVREQCWHELTQCPLYVRLNPTLGTPLSEWGAFLPTPFYYEETWCCYHARAHGWKVVYYGPVLVEHEWHQSVKQNGKEQWATKCFNDSRTMFRAACDLHGIAHD